MDGCAMAEGWTFSASASVSPNVWASLMRRRKRRSSWTKEAALPLSTKNGMPLADPRMDGLCQILDGKYMDRTRYNLEEVSYDAVNHEVYYV
jgi:hypothetical protein